MEKRGPNDLIPYHENVTSVEMGRFTPDIHVVIARIEESNGVPKLLERFRRSVRAIHPDLRLSYLDI